jgi:hypothetical protein
LNFLVIACSCNRITICYTTFLAAFIEKNLTFGNRMVL